MRQSLAFRPAVVIFLLILTSGLALLLLARPAHGQPGEFSFYILANRSEAVAPAPRFAALPTPGSALALRLDLRGPAAVRWNVFDMGGRRVANRDYGTLGGGAHPIIWDGCDRYGREVAAGTYWIQIQAGDRLIAREVVW